MMVVCLTGTIGWLRPLVCYWLSTMGSDEVVLRRRLGIYSYRVQETSLHHARHREADLLTEFI